MSIITSNASCNPSSISVTGKKNGSGTISWSLPTVPAGGTINSCKLTGTCTITDSSGKPATVKVNGTSVSSRVAFTINLGTGNTTSSVAVAATGPHKNTKSTITFSNLVYTVDYETNVTYTVTFKDWNGTTLKTETVKEGSSAIAPSSPTRDGYTFTGWDVSFSNVTSDLTVTAQYEKIREQHLIARYITNASGVVPDFNSGYQYEINETESDGIYTVEITSEEDFSTFKFRINNTNLIGIEYLNVTSAVTSLDSSFYGCTKLQYVNGIDKWDISNSSLTRMYSLFDGCSLLSTIDFSSLNNHNINMMMSAFNGCTNLNFVNLDGFINSSVTNISYLFYDCSGLETIIMNNCDLSNATVNSSFSMNTRSLKNIEMKNTNYTSVNKVISDLPTRTTDSPGTLNIEGIDDFSQVDITTAQSKFWNVVGVELEEEVIEWTGMGTVASGLFALSQPHSNYKINLDWENECFDIVIVEGVNYNPMIINPPVYIGDIVIGENKYSITDDEGYYSVYLNNEEIYVAEEQVLSYPMIIRFNKEGIHLIVENEAILVAEIIYETNQPIYVYEDNIPYDTGDYDLKFNLVVSELPNEEPEVIEWTGIGTVAINLSNEDDWTYKLNIDWDTQYVEINNIVTNTEMFNHGADVLYINNEYNFTTGDQFYCDESDTLVIICDETDYQPDFYSYNFSIKISKNDGLVFISNIDDSIYEIKKYHLIENSPVLYLSSLVRISENSYSNIGEIKVVGIESEEPDNNELVQGDINDETGVYEDEVPNVVKTKYIDISDKKQILVNVLTEDVYVLKCYLYNANKELVKIIDISADKKRMFGLDLQKLIEEVMNDGNE